jgi:hypothetical protein
MIEIRAENDKTYLGTCDKNGQVEVFYEKTSIKKFIKLYSHRYLSTSTSCGNEVLAFDSDYINMIYTSLIEHPTEMFPVSINFNEIRNVKLPKDREKYHFKVAKYAPIGCVNPDPTLFRPCIENFDALCAFVDILFNGGPRHQYIWLYGQGGTGKTSFTTALYEYLGSDLCVRLTKAHTGCRFDNSVIAGKRLVIVEEAETFEPSSSFFKSLTGSDEFVVEEKYKSPRISKNECMFIIESNQPPNLDMTVADLRRIIPCKVPKLETKCEIYSVKEKMIELFPQFLGYCKNVRSTLDIQASIPCELSRFENEDNGGKYAMFEETLFTAFKFGSGCIKMIDLFRIMRSTNSDLRGRDNEFVGFLRTLCEKYSDRLSLTLHNRCRYLVGILQTEICFNPVTPCM